MHESCHTSRRPRGVRALAAAALTVLITATAAAAAPGDLDASFGNGGVVGLPAFGTGWSVALQDQGRILVGGRSGRDFVVVRLQPNGELDTAFGAAGYARVRFTDLFQEGGSIAVDSAGRILLAGSAYVEGTGFNFGVARFTADGVLDPSFGSAGKVLLDFGNSNDRVHGVAIGAGGDIVLAGETVQYPPGLSKSMLVARLTSSGALDPTFDGNGWVVSNFPANPAFFNGDDDVAWSAVLDQDGEIVVGGNVAGGAAAVQYDESGALDATFGTAGVATTGLIGPWRFEAFDLVVDDSGSVVLAGGAGFGVGLARFTPSGTLDASFDGDGKVLVEGAPLRAAWAVALQRDGALVVGGWGYGPGSRIQLAVGRFLSNGAVDSDFGSGGFAAAASPFGFDAFGRDVAIQPDGRIVVVGGDPGIVAARFEGSPPDVTPPTIVMPSSLTVNATSPAGAVVEYEVSATDDVDPSPVVSCSPPSGSTFPIGDTGVLCTATDAAVNSSMGSFNVHVKRASEQVADMIALVDSYQLDKLGTSLQDKLVSVQGFLTAGKSREAEENLAAFIAQVRAQRGKGLTHAQTDELEIAARRIIEVIET